MSDVSRELVRSAFIYAQPLAEVYRQFSLQLAFQGPANRLMAFRGLADASFRAVPTPNNDTVYTVFAFDLRHGPLVIETPRLAPDRYTVLPFYDAFTNVFASFGTRTETYGPLRLLLTPPEWQGAVPDGVTELRSPSMIGSMLGRILVSGEADLPEVQAIQDQFVVEPLSSWLAGTRTPLMDFEHPEPVADYRFVDVRSDPASFWEGVGEIIAGAPIPEGERALVESFAPLGLSESGFVMPSDPAVRELLLDETTASWQFLARFAADQSQAEELGVSFFTSNGWGWSSAVRDAQNTGRLFYGDQFLLRAWANYLYYGILPPDEALYPAAYVDHEGHTLNGDHVYTWTIPAGARAVRPLGFTSVSLYDMDGYFFDNPDRVYKIGDRDTNLVTDPEGSVTITISARRPEGPANWLPAPAGEDFYLIYRMYLPSKQVLDGSYELQPIVRQP